MTIDKWCYNYCRGFALCIKFTKYFRQSRQYNDALRVSMIEYSRWRKPVMRGSVFGCAICLLCVLHLQKRPSIQELEPEGHAHLRIPDG
jgi:hypothetical protein